MTEKVEVTQSNGEKQKKILSLKMLDEVKDDKWKYGYKLSNWNDYCCLIIEGKTNGSWIYFNQNYRGRIEDAALSTFVWVDTEISNYPYSSARMIVKNRKSYSENRKSYDYNGKKIFHIENSRLMTDENKDFIYVLNSDWCNTWYTNKIHRLIWIVNGWEIVLKKYDSDDDGISLGETCSYVTFPWTKIVQLDEDSSIFYVINDGNIDIIKVDEKTFRENKEKPITYTHQETLSFEQFWEIKQIQTDKNKNFVLIIWKKWEKSSLYVLRHNDWTWWEAIATIDGVTETVVLPDNTLFCVMEDWKIKKVSTTFDQFEKWFFEKGWTITMREESIKKVRNNANEKMLEAIRLAKLWENDKNELPDEKEISEEDIISEFWSKTAEWENKTIKELFDEATTIEQIDKIERDINWVLISISSYTWSLKIKNKIKEEIKNKRDEILLKDLENDVDQAEKAYNSALDIRDYVALQSLVEILHDRRKEIQWRTDAEIKLWKRIIELRTNISNKIKESKDSGKESIIPSVEKNIEELREYAWAISYWRDLSWMYNLDLWKETAELIDYLNDEDKKKYKKELYSIISKKSKELQKEEKEEESKKSLELEEQKKWIEEELDILIGMLETIHSVEAVNEMKSTDVLARRIEEGIKALPPAIRWELEIKYNKAFKDRIFNIRREGIKEKGIVQNLDDSWINTMLYYVENQKEEIKRELKWTPTAQWTVKIWIAFNDGSRKYTWDNFFEDSQKYSDVIIWDDIDFEITQKEYVKLNSQLGKWLKYGKPKLEKLLQELNKETDKEKKHEISEKIKELKSEFSKPRYVEKIANRLIKKEKFSPRLYVPEIDHNYIVLKDEKKVLKEISWKLLRQRKRSGITVLKWWPGLWKTAMCEYLAAVTNREIIRVQCSKKIPYADFFFAPTLKPGESVRKPAEWIKMMQKPWTIILFDELDKLNGDCLAWLHALFDWWRFVHDTQEWNFSANPDCFFIGTMNAYDPIPKPIASRATFKEIRYPSEENEAYKISKYIDDDFITGLSFQEFEELWNNQVKNWWKTKNAKEHKLYEMLNNIKKLLDVFKILRSKYEADYDRFEYELSYRDASTIFDTYAINNDFRSAILEELVNKADSVVWVEDKKGQRDMVEDAVKEVFW